MCRLHRQAQMSTNASENKCVIEYHLKSSREDSQSNQNKFIVCIVVTLITHFAIVCLLRMHLLQIIC